MKKLKVLIGCEESQAVCIEFRKLGHGAYSCDLQECSGGHPEWHLKMDVFEAIKMKCPQLLIIHPPCDHLAVSGAAWFEIKKSDGRQQKAIDFFMRCVNADVEYICIENPIGIMSTEYQKPDQIINPFHFGDAVRKPTCLWLKGLPKLFWAKQNDLFTEKTTVIPEVVTMTSEKTGRTRTYSKWEYEASCNQKERKKIRSKTFPGIARAMAEQWSDYLTNTPTTNPATTPAPVK